MGTNEKELYELMEDEGMEIIKISNLGIKLDGENVTHAIAMTDWRTKEKCVDLTHGHPSNREALYWSSKGNWQNNEFDMACKKIVKGF